MQTIFYFPKRNLAGRYAPVSINANDQPVSTRTKSKLCCCIINNFYLTPNVIFLISFENVEVKAALAVRIQEKATNASFWALF